MQPVHLLVIIVLAFAPGIFWLWLIYHADRYRPEPRKLVIRVFLLGMAIALPIAVIEGLLYPSPGGVSGLSNLSIGTAAYVAFVVAGVTEETGKFLVVKQTMFKSRFFDEPVDGIVYSAAVALGFASLENVGYLLGSGWQTILLRGFFSVIAHVLFSAVWGYPLAISKVHHGAVRWYVWFWLVAAMASHGLFDFLLFTQHWWSLLVIPLFLGAVVIFVLVIRHANRISPYRWGV
jgi:RsiW-degrading membrane proteinase PrsW (M82 family)